MYKLIVALLLVAMLIDCNSKQSNKSEIDNIEVSYIKGAISTHTPLVCGQIRSMFPELRKDTVLTDVDFLIKVENLITTLKKDTEKKDIGTCDIRVQCSLNYKDKGSKTICIGKFNCIEFDGMYVGECDSLAYLIKRESGYYNYFNGMILNHFKEIQQFGLPINHKYLIDTLPH